MRKKIPRTFISISWDWLHFRLGISPIFLRSFFGSQEKNMGEILSYIVKEE
jgi:hypothetical protein